MPRNLLGTAMLTLPFAMGMAVLGSGCGPSIPAEELGEIVSDVNDVPGSDVRYPLPEFEPPPEDDQNAAATSEAAQDAPPSSGEAEPPESEVSTPEDASGAEGGAAPSEE